MDQVIFEAEFVIRGRVQLVMFRDFVRRKAKALGLCGFVRNNPNGTVTILAQGGKEKLDMLAVHLEEGPFLSKVESVSAAWRSLGQPYKNFTILY